MPSPIAHAVTGYCLARLWPRFETSGPRLPARWSCLGLGIFAAIAADVDFVPKLVAGLDTHRGITHSMGFAIACSIVLAVIFGRRSRRACRAVCLLSATSYLSHLLLDLLTTGGRGIPVFWPLSEALVQFSVTPFPQVHHSEGLWYAGHIPVLIFESAYSLVLLGLIYGSRRSRRYSPQSTVPASQDAAAEQADATHPSASSSR